VRCGRGRGGRGGSACEEEREGEDWGTAEEREMGEKKRIKRGMRREYSCGRAIIGGTDVDAVPTLKFTAGLDLVFTLKNRFNSINKQKRSIFRY